MNRRLAIERVSQYVVGDRPLRLVLVGCGGTGGYAALHAARIIYHARANGTQEVELVLVDGDTVAEHNVGRQFFSRAEVGQPKAQTLAARLSIALECPIIAIPEYASETLLSELRPPYDMTGVLIGAVDNHEARLVLKKALDNRSFKLWVDAGNHYQTGQIVAGTTNDRRELFATLEIDGLCRHLPSAALLYPEILEPPSAQEAMQEACAAAMQTGIQSLMVNTFQGAMLGDYIANLVLHRRLTTYCTELDLSSGGATVRSRPITISNLAADLSLTEAQLRGRGRRPRSSRSTKSQQRRAA